MDEAMIFVPSNLMFYGNLPILTKWFCTTVRNNPCRLLLCAVLLRLEQQYITQPLVTELPQDEQISDMDFVIHMAATQMGNHFAAMLD
jgi:hypothetical protein